MRHLAGTCMLIVAAAPASALSFAFSFDNPGGGPVGVVIRGLADDATGPASSVSVTLNDGGGGFGVGEYLSATSSALNRFTLSDGYVIDFAFESLGINNTLPAVICCTLAFNRDDSGSFFAGLSNNPMSVTPGPVDTIVFVPIDDIDAPMPVPAPAALPMLASAIAALGLFVRRRRSAGA